MRVHSFESFGTVDGPGIRFVVFAQGCVMRCKYCHNPDTWNVGGGKEISVEEIANEALKYKSYFGKNGGVTVSGGEPLLQIDELIKLFTLLKQNGVHTCVDTSGICFRETDERYEKLLALTDLFLLDIKHIDEEGHKTLTGHSNGAPLAFAKYLSGHQKPMWIRHVLVPDITDTDEQLLRLRGFLDTLETVEKVEVLPYHTMGKVKYDNLGMAYPLEGVEPPTKERIQNAKKILQERNI
ncbi:MAG: pyruvate formate lyase-activating protein [Clostridia bacterium]|nr:pyruvate formate lyase-activating protein [Clostridia bacterium]